MKNPILDVMSMFYHILSSRLVYEKEEDSVGNIMHSFVIINGYTVILLREGSYCRKPY